MIFCKERLMAMSIMQEGPSPTFLAPSIAQYLATGTVSRQPAVEELPNEHQRKIWSEVGHVINIII